MTPAERVEIFRADLSVRRVPELVQRHITGGDCYALTRAMEQDLRTRVANEFGVHPTAVAVVGSAKLGFSIAPKKRYRFFGETSDIDVTIASSKLFDELWREVYDHWRRGEVWEDLGQFRKYLFRGWMRPDKLPPEHSFQRSREWWEFFRALTASGDFGPFKICGALYKDWHFLETYQERCVTECQALEVATS